MQQGHKKADRKRQVACVALQLEYNLKKYVSNTNNL